MISLPSRSRPKRLRGTLNSSRGAFVGTLGSLGGPQNWAELNFNLDVFQVRKFHDLVESFLANRRFGLLKGQVLALDDGPAHGALALGVALYASFQGHIENHQSRGNLEPLPQVEQILPCLRGQRSRVHHTQAIHRKPLFDKEMHQRKGLGVAALVTLVVADAGARPIRRDDLGGPEVTFGEGGFPASRRAAKHHDRRPQQAHRLPTAITFVWNILGVHKYL